MENNFNINRMFNDISHLMKKAINLGQTGIIDTIEAIDKIGVNEGIIIPTPHGVIVAPYPDGQDIDEYIQHILESDAANRKDNKTPASEKNNTKQTNNKSNETAECNCSGCKNDCMNEKPCSENDDETDITIDKVIYRENATIILFADGTKTVAKCDDHDEFNPTAGFAIALLKKMIGNKQFHSLIEDLVFPEYEKLAAAKMPAENEHVTENNDSSATEEQPVKKSTRGRKPGSTTKKTSKAKSPAKKKTTAGRKSSAKNTSTDETAVKKNDSTETTT